MRMLFGTDGIRGVAGDPPLDHNTIFAVGAALGRYLARNNPSPRIIIGQDTRESSRWIADSITQGLACAGVAVQSAGVITTPAVACLARGGFSAGVVISASHNPWTDNGIKIFGHDGYKLTDETEEKIEGDIFALLHGNDVPASAAQATEAAAVGTDAALLKQYLGWLAGNCTERRCHSTRETTFG